MLRRPASLLPRLLFSSGRRVGPRRAGGGGRGYACGVGISRAGGAVGTGSGGTRCAVDTASLQASSVGGLRSLLRRSVMGLRWRHSGSGPQDDGSKELVKMYIAVNKAIAECRAKGDAEGLLGIVRKQSRKGGASALELNFVNCATFLNGWSRLDLARLRGPCPPEVLLVLGRAVHLLKTQPHVWGPQAIGNVANGVSKLQYQWAPGAREHVVLMEELAQWSVLRGLGEFRPQEICNLVNAFAKLGRSPGEALLGMIAQECVGRRLQGFTPQNIANIVNAFAKLEYPPGEALLGMIVQECVSRGLRGFNAQAIANIVNAFARLEYSPGEALLGMIAQECVGRGLQGFSAQAIANIVNAFAKLEHSPGEALLGMIAQECVGRGLQGFNAQDIANIVNAFAKLEHSPGEALLGMIAQECVGCGLQGFSPQAIANIVNAFTKLEHYPGKDLSDLICRKCVRGGLSGFNAQNIANLLHGLATLRHHPGRELLDLSASRCLAMCFKAFNGQDLSNVLQALALCGHAPSQAFVGAFLERCRELGWGAFINQSLNLTLWSWLVLQLEVDKGLLQEIVARMRVFRTCAVGAKERLNGDDMMALCTVVKQWVSLTGGGEESELHQEVDRVWEIVGSRLSPPRPSRLQRDVCKALEARRYKVEEEVVLSDGVVSLDMVVMLEGGRRVGVEVDGPLHFFRNRPQEAMGHTQLKRRLLERAVERGELQGWVSVRRASAEAMRQVDRAVKTAERS